MLTGEFLTREDPLPAFSGVFQMLTKVKLVVCHVFYDITWNKIAPLNVFLFFWWLLRNRIPIKYNLSR